MEIILQQLVEGALAGIWPQELMDEDENKGGNAINGRGMQCRGSKSRNHVHGQKEARMDTPAVRSSTPLPRLPLVSDFVKTFRQHWCPRISREYGLFGCPETEHHVLET